MTASSLEHTEESPSVVGKGHTTAALGPSDSSDSGSDMQGATVGAGVDDLIQRTGLTAEPDVEMSAAVIRLEIDTVDSATESDREDTGDHLASASRTHFDEPKNRDAPIRLRRS